LSVDKVGNLTLLEGKVNKRIRNRVYRSKAIDYQKIDEYQDYQEFVETSTTSLHD